jgi:hypothetical protein
MCWTIDPKQIAVSCVKRSSDSGEAFVAKSGFTPRARLLAMTIALAGCGGGGGGEGGGPPPPQANRPPAFTNAGPVNFAEDATGTVFTATASDPDKNALTIKWWQYGDADTYPGIVTFGNPDALTTTFQVPTDATTGHTIHALIQVTDNGSPALTSFQRVIVTVKAP